MGLIFDGVDLEERFGLMVDGASTWVKPARDRSVVHVPGRNGDLIFDNGCWQNVTITYNFLIKDGWQQMFEEFARWICRKRGYFKLEDPDRHPDVYRMAEVAETIDPELWFTTRTGVFPIAFNCKPQQFLYTGDAPLYRLLPRIATKYVRTQYMPISGTTIKYTPKIDPSVVGTVTGAVYAYDSGKVQVETSGAVTLTSGTAASYTITDASAAYWVLEIDVNSADNIDLVNARVVADTVISGKTVPFDAVLGRSLWYENPTGYATKPLIQYFGSTYYADFYLYKDGEIDSWYTLHLNDYSTLSDNSIMDCEMQCLYYEYLDGNGVKKKGNLGSYLIMTDAQSAVGQALSFPELSEDKTNIQLYTISADEIGLYILYPRWWRI